MQSSGSGCSVCLTKQTTIPECDSSHPLLDIQTPRTLHQLQKEVALIEIDNS